MSAGRCLALMRLLSQTGLLAELLANLPLATLLRQTSASTQGRPFFTTSASGLARCPSEKQCSFVHKPQLSKAHQPIDEAWKAA